MGCNGLTMGCNGSLWFVMSCIGLVLGCNTWDGVCNGVQ